MTASTIPKPDPKLWYVCVMNYAADDGTYREGDRLRGDHPTVKAVPIWWVPEGLSTDELHAARQARLRLAYPEK